MGDFLSPKRRDIFDRFRRRVEDFRNRHIESSRRFEPSIRRHYQQEQQETVLLHQKYLENRAKKASKQNKTTKDTTTPAEHRNLIVTQKLKRKIDGSNPLESQPVDTSAYAFNEADSPPTKKTATDSSNNTGDTPALSSVSVHIVQQFSGGTSQEQQIQTNVTLKTHFGPSDESAPGNDLNATNIDTSTHVECKQEPVDESDQSKIADNDIAFDKELEAILNTFEKEGDEIPAEIIKQLNEFDQIYKEVQQSETNDCSVKSGMFAGPMSSTSPGLTKVGVFPDSASPGSIHQMYDAPTNMGPVGTPPLPSFRAQPQAPVPSLSESGPAAETLKQMAAHHQNQQGPTEYGIKGVLPQYTEPLPENTTFQNRNGYNVEYPQQNQPAQQPAQQQFNAQMQSSVYLNTQQGQVGEMRTPLQYPQTKRERDMLTYGQTKPLTHYSQPHGGAKAGAQAQPQGQTQPPTQSSLQQLQNFTQGQMQVTQTQHMQVTDGTNRLQMSQTQQMQMRPPVQQLSVSQQQSFSMTSNMAGGAGPTPTPPSQFSGQSQAQPNQGQQYMNDQMNLQMYEKMRHEQRQQKIIEQQAAQQMQQYMNRPPRSTKYNPVPRCRLRIIRTPPVRIRYKQCKIW
ncbi:hypothetical protein ScPMuIL_010604 [Solemya velum]